MEPVRQTFIDTSYSGAAQVRATGLPLRMPQRVVQKATVQASNKEGVVVYRVRLCLRILSFLVSATTVGILGQALYAYKWTESNPDTERHFIAIRLWAEQYTIRPIHLLLGAACVSTFLSGIICIASVSKAIRRLTSVGNSFALAISSVCLVLWIAAVVYYGVNHIEGSRTFSPYVKDVCSAQGAQWPSMRKLCLGMRFGFYGGIAFAALELVSILVSVCGVVITRRAGKAYFKIREKSGDDSAPLVT